MLEQFEVESGGLRVKGVFACPDGGQARFPCVVFSHGLISSKESSKYVELVDIFRNAGIAGCRFDYHGCGESDGLLEETTLTTRVSNLDAVVKWVSRHPSVDNRRIGLLGSSFGGCTSLIKTARDKRIACLSLWATPYRLSKDQDTIDGIRFRDTLYADFARYDLLSEAQRVSGALVIHGDLDETVPAGEGRAIYEHLREPKRFELIRGGDHTFSDSEHRRRAFGLAVEWFSRALL